MDFNGLSLQLHLWLLLVLITTLCFLHLTVCDDLEDTGQGQETGVKEEDDPWDTEKFRKEADQTYNLMFHKYNHRLRPPVPFVEIDAAVTLTHIRHFDVGRQELQIILSLEMNWMDSRLRWLPYKVKEIHESAQQVWRPDLIYLNGIAPVEDLYPDIVRIVHNGSVSWLRKEIVTTRCETDPTSSVQTCPIQMGFATNSLAGNEQDRFFFSDKTTATVADGELFTHHWRLSSFEMNLGDENDTMSSVLELDLALARIESKSSGGNHKGEKSGNPGRHTTDDRVTDDDDDDDDGGSSEENDDCNAAIVYFSDFGSLLLLVCCVITSVLLVGSPTHGHGGGWMVDIVLN